MTFSIDVLPAPFGPMMARISPLRMLNETSEIARTPPKASETFSTSSRMSCRAHAARLPVAAAAGWRCRSTIFTRPEMTPLRPSSNVTSVEMSASFEPS